MEKIIYSVIELSKIDKKIYLLVRGSFDNELHAQKKMIEIANNYTGIFKEERILKYSCSFLEDEDRYINISIEKNLLTID